MISYVWEKEKELRPVCFQGQTRGQKFRDQNREPFIFWCETLKADDVPIILMLQHIAFILSKTKHNAATQAT